MSKSRTKKKSNKFKISHRTIVLFGVLIVLVICGVVGFFIWKNYKPNNFDAVAFQNKVKEADSQYRYQAIGIDVEQSDADGNVLVSSYTMSIDKQDTFRTYQYFDSTGDSLNQMWKQIDGGWALYIYSTEAQNWVLCRIDEEPFVYNKDGLIEAIGDYTLEKETKPWGVNQEECYVFSKIQTNVQNYAAIYEYIYVSKESNLVLGAITYAASDATAEKVTEIAGDPSINISGGTMTEQTGAVLLMRYEFLYSNEDLALFEVPSYFMTEEEWMEQYGAN